MLEIRPSRIHGQGLFATEPIAAGQRIVEYIGEKISKAESHRRCQEQNFFIFYLDDSFDLDGSGESNRARLINHSCRPNCDAELENGGVWIVARRMICTGEELTFNYNYDLDEYRDHPCQCGASNCVGYMVAEEFFDTIRTSFAHGGARAIEH